MPEEWFRTQRLFRLVKARRKNDRGAWAKKMIERQKDRVAKPGELSNDELQQVSTPSVTATWMTELTNLWGRRTHLAPLSPSADLTEKSSATRKRGTVTANDPGYGPGHKRY